MFLASAALLLLAVIALQNYLYAPLRQETISDGLYGPYHWLLDGAYVVLATALLLAFRGKGFSELLAVIASFALLVTAVTNTFSGFVDKLTGGLHSKLHSWFTLVMFVFMLGLEGSQSGIEWVVANLVIPLAVYSCVSLFKETWAPGPATEKAAVVVLCAWMVYWSL